PHVGRGDRRGERSRGRDRCWARPRPRGRGQSGLGSSGSPYASRGVVSVRRSVLNRASIFVLVVALAVTLSLSLMARGLHDSNEKRLLRQQVSAAAAVISAAIPNVQTPLSSGAVLAEATNSDRRAFTNLMTPLAAGTP